MPIYIAWVSIGIVNQKVTVIKPAAGVLMVSTVAMFKRSGDMKIFSEDSAFSA